MFSFRKINPVPKKMEEPDLAAEKQRLYLSIFIPFVFVALMWLVKLFEYTTGVSLVKFGIYPRTFHGLTGIIAAPFIHADFNHIFSNTIPFLILGFLMLFNYRRVAFQSFIFIYLFSGCMVWLIGRPSYHVGASSLIYGFAFFIFFSGIFRKDIQSVALSLLIVFLYGSIVWGMFPIDWQLSWEGHLMGGIAGAIMAFIFRKVDVPPQIELDDDDDDSDDFTEINYEIKESEEKKDV